MKSKQEVADLFKTADCIVVDASGSVHHVLANRFAVQGQVNTIQLESSYSEFDRALERIALSTTANVLVKGYLLNFCITQEIWLVYDSLDPETRKSGLETFDVDAMDDFGDDENDEDTDSDEDDDSEDFLRMKTHKMRFPCRKQPISPAREHELDLSEEVKPLLINSNALLECCQESNGNGCL